MQSNLLRGRAIAQAVSRWLPTAAVRVRGRVWSSGACGGQSGAGTGFLRVLRFPLPLFIPPNSPSSQSPGAGTIGQLAADVPSGPSLDFTPNMRIKKKMFCDTTPCKPAGEPISFFAYSSTLKMVAICSSKTSVDFQLVDDVISQKRELFHKVVCSTSERKKKNMGVQFSSLLWIWTRRLLREPLQSKLQSEHSLLILKRN
jgi:hypothetical protein